LGTPQGNFQGVVRQLMCHEAL